MEITWCCDAATEVDRPRSLALPASGATKGAVRKKALRKQGALKEGAVRRSRVRRGAAPARLPSGQAVMPGGTLTHHFPSAL